MLQGCLSEPPATASMPMSSQSWTFRTLNRRSDVDLRALWSHGREGETLSLTGAISRLRALLCAGGQRLSIE